MEPWTRARAGAPATPRGDFHAVIAAGERIGFGEHATAAAPAASGGGADDAAFTLQLPCAALRAAAAAADAGDAAALGDERAAHALAHAVAPSRGAVRRLGRSAEDALRALLDPQRSSLVAVTARHCLDTLATTLDVGDGRECGAAGDDACAVPRATPPGELAPDDVCVSAHVVAWCSDAGRGATTTCERTEFDATNDGADDGPCGAPGLRDSIARWLPANATAAGGSRAGYLDAFARRHLDLAFADGST